MAKVDIVDGKIVRRDNKEQPAAVPQQVPKFETRHEPLPEQRQPEQFQRPPQVEQYQRPMQQEQYLPQEELPQFTEEELKAAYQEKLMQEYAEKEAIERRMMMEKQKAEQSNIISFHLVMEGNYQIDFGVTRQDANTYNQTLQRAMEKGDIIQIGRRVISARHISTYWFE
jgi:2-succinyl-5-enolpyruvyl-6-hydroxy-3-cyclohexene-1-carboxylate synthase